MSKFIKSGFIKSGFVKGSSSNNDNIDYDKIFKYIDDRLSNLETTINLSKDFLSTKIHNLDAKFDDLNNCGNLEVDLSPLDKKLSNLQKDIKEIKNKEVDLSSINEVLSNLQNQNIFNLSPSLNGTFGSFKDNDFITSSIYPVKLQVLSSGLLLNSENNYIIIYKVKNENSDILYLPSFYVFAYEEKEE